MARIERGFRSALASGRGVDDLKAKLQTCMYHRAPSRARDELGRGHCLLGGAEREGNLKSRMRRSCRETGV